MAKLTPYEQEILHAFESGKLRPTADAKQAIELVARAAKNTTEKTKNINLRLSVRDIERLKTKSFETGLPYQTLAASVLRQYASGKISIKL